MVYYKVVEVAELLGVSKVTIYDKLKSLKKELRPFVKVTQNKTFIADEGVELIKSSLKVNQVVSKDEEELNNNLTVQENEYVLSLINQIEFLRQQIDTKDDQLRSKDELLVARDELLKNFQILLKQEQDTRLLLEEKFKDQESKPKGLWSKLFNR